MLRTILVMSVLFFAGCSLPNLPEAPTRISAEEKVNREILRAYLRENLNDGEFEEMDWRIIYKEGIDDYTMLRMRARNGFGGKVIGYAIRNNVQGTVKVGSNEYHENMWVQGK